MSASGAAWLGDDYEAVFRIATGMPRMHEHLVERLAPASRERWLDVATGTGRVARLAARAGAAVTGQDESEGMIEAARRLTAEEGLEIRFDVSDCRAMPYGDGVFDIVSSAVGAIFAPDHEAVAGELARVCRRGGRLGLVAWRPDPEFTAIFEPFEEPAASGADYSDWGREEYVTDRLGSWYELGFEEGDAPMTGASGPEIWEVWLRAIASTRALYESLGDAKRQRLRDRFVAYFERFRTPDGAVEQPNAYLLVLGTRR